MQFFLRMSEFQSQVSAVFTFEVCETLISTFLKNYKRCVLFFLKCLEEFIDKLSGSGIFFGERFLNYRFKFFIHTGLFIVLISSSISFGRLCFSNNLSISSKLSNLSAELFLEYLYCAICSDILFLASIVANLRFVYFLNVSLVSVLSVVLIFWKN